MKLKPISANQTEITLPDGKVVLFSYQTAVAAFIPGRGAIITETHYSRTTTKHINQAVLRWGCSKTIVPQSEIDALTIN